MFGFFALVPRPADDDHASLIQNGNFDSPLGPEWSFSDLKATVIKVKGPSFKKALHLEISPMDMTKPRSAMLWARTSSMVHLETTVYVRAWMRGTAGPLQSVGVKLTDSPAPLFLSEPLQITTKWKEFKFATTVKPSLLPGQLEIDFAVGTSGTVDIANIRVEDYGDTPAADLTQTKNVEPRSHHKTS